MNDLEDVGTDAPGCEPIGLALPRITFSGPDELPSVCSSWGLEALQLSHAEGRNWTAPVQLKRLHLQATAMAGRVKVRGSLPRARIVMEFDLGSDGIRRLGGRAAGADDVLVGIGGAEFDYVSPEHHYGATFSVPSAVVAKALMHRAPWARELIQSASTHVLSHCVPHAARIRELVKATFGPASQPLDPPAIERAHAAVVSAMVDTLLSCWNREATARFHGAQYHRLPIVRRVEAFMRANLGDPIMLHDFCEAGRASERAVEYAFRDIYGVGAKQYLKLLRLNQVRRYLKARPSEVATVAQVAQRFGFWHMGHFSAAYRRLFGETPQQTLGRA